MILRSTRYLPIAALIAYSAVCAFVALPHLIATARERGQSAAPVMQGVTTKQMDDSFRAALPHRGLAEGVWGAGRWLVFGEGRSGVIAGRDGWLFTSEEARPMPEPVSASVARISVLRDTLAEMGTRLVVVPVPGKADIYAARSTAPAMTDNLATRYRDFLTDAEHEGIAVADTRSAMENEPAGEPLFFATDTHWTTQGAAVAAQATARLVAGMMAPGDMTFSPEPKPAHDFTGDLAKFITSEKIAPLIGFGPETAHPFVAQPVGGSSTAADIFSAARPDTVLVGTSYSFNPNWSFAESLKIDLGRDLLNYAKEGQGPVAPFLEMLADADFRADPPRLVIWEIPLRYLSDPKIWIPPEDAAAVRLAHGIPAATLGSIGTHGIAAPKTRLAVVDDSFSASGGDDAP